MADLKHQPHGRVERNPLVTGQSQDLTEETALALTLALMLAHQCSTRVQLLQKRLQLQGEFVRLFICRFLLVSECSRAE